LLKLVYELNADASVDGILVQMPLSANIDDETMIERIAPEKDVEGFHPFNIGRLATKLPALRPVTPRGVMKLLGHAAILIRGNTRSWSTLITWDDRCPWSLWPRTAR